MSMDMVIWHDDQMCTVPAAALHVKNGIPGTALYLGQLCQLIIQRTQINCVKVSALYRQMDVEDKCLWSTIRLGWLSLHSIKLHVMLLLYVEEPYTLVHSSTCTSTNLKPYSTCAYI